MNNTLVRTDTGELITVEQPLTAAQVKAQVQLIQQVMEAVMEEGIHYGTIPGCGNKPTLLKPGAEKLSSTFRLALEPVIEEKNDGDSISFLITTKVTNINGAYLGSGVGFASTKEDKYNWRAAITEAEYNATPEDRRRIKYAVDKETGEDLEIKQVRTNPYDIANTVLKMADKRSAISVILKVLAASDIFTQDLEDNPEQFQRNTKGALNDPYQFKGVDKYQPKSNALALSWRPTDKAIGWLHGEMDKKKLTSDQVIAVMKLGAKKFESEAISNEITTDSKVFYKSLNYYQWRWLKEAIVKGSSGLYDKEPTKEEIIATGEKAAEELHG